MADTLVLGVPLPFVKAYANTLDQLSSAMAANQTARQRNDTMMLSILKHSMYVLQGRLEGVALGYLFWCEENEPDLIDADAVNERLQEAHAEWARDGRLAD